MTAPTTEQLREMIAGTDNTASSPWRVGLVDDTRVEDADGNEVAMIDGDYNSPDLWPIMEANAAHIARCDPATIRAMAEEIIAAREREQDVKAAVLAEREACAKTAEYCLGNSGALRPYVSNAIRARQENGT